ncbi:MAG: hypothetical protein JO274_08910, partial [Gammaproteobacteria bacterium]|nr:hypothetical protein [Gammaproteobacteria bacterium]
GSTPGDLAPLELRRAGRLLLVRAAGGPSAAAVDTDESVWAAFAGLTPSGVTERDVAADWKLVVEQWLETPLPQHRFVAPNQLLEVRTDGACILQVVPSTAGRCRLRRFEFIRSRGAAPRARRASTPPRATAWLSGQIALAESTQAGLQGASDAVVEAGPIAPALAQFRAQIGALWRALSQERGGR